MPNRNIIKSKKQKGKHSCPSTSGIQNLPKSYIKRVSGTGGGLMENLMPVYTKGFANRRDYAGKWTAEILEQEVIEFFEFCTENDVKPAKAGLKMWLGISDSQFWEWETNTASHPLKSKVIESANRLMQMQYIGKGEKNPTFNIFLLKSGHGYSDKQEIQINSGNDVDSDEIADAVKKLGLDKEE